MPNKYQREIEEILRNMERADQSQTVGDRIRAFNRPAPRTRLRGPRMTLRVRLSTSEACLVAGVLLALVGATIAYYFGAPITGPWAYVGGAIGVAALVCVATGLGIGWHERFARRGPAVWRGQPVTRPRALQPLGALGTQVRIMRLKWRYWRSRGQ
jgi:hypothetical protein